MDSDRTERENVRKSSRRQQLEASDSPSNNDLGLPSLTPPTRRKSRRHSSERSKKGGSERGTMAPSEGSSRASGRKGVSKSQSAELVLSESTSPIPPFQGRRLRSSRMSEGRRSESSESQERQSGLGLSMGFKIDTAVPHEQSDNEDNPAEQSQEVVKSGDVTLPLPPWLHKLKADEEATRETKLLDQKYNSMKTLTGIKTDGDTAETTRVSPSSGSGKENYDACQIPGAYEVRRRAPGYLPSWFRRDTAESRPGHSPSSEFGLGEILEDNYEEIKLPFRWGLCLGMVLCVIVILGAGIGVGVAVLSGGDSGNDEGPPETTDDVASPESQQKLESCDFTGIAQPDPFLQCTCTSSISVISDTTNIKYNDLRDRFVTSVLPSGFDYDITSCEPYNVALVWLAIDTESRRTDWTVMRNRYVLAILYAIWDGGTWTQNSLWLSSEPECNWFGVSCIRSVVTELILPENNIHGLVPTEIGLLTGLRVVDFSNNYLEGHLPEELYQATDLEQLILWTNSLEGTISDRLGWLTNLRVFGIEENMFSGTLPSSMANLFHMKWFLVQGNDFQGPLFDKVVQWPNIEALEMRSNSFVGTIPSEIGTLSKLRILDTSANDFHGTFPTEMGNIASMEYLVADGHQLSGSIPTELGKWDKLAHISIMTGRLEGTIPSELGRLLLLEDIVLPANNLSGSIPSEFGNCASLRRLDVGRNPVTGFVPSELGMLSNLRSLKIDGTKIQGAVPQEVCNLREDSMHTFWIPCRTKLQCDISCCTPQCSR